MIKTRSTTKNEFNDQKGLGSPLGSGNQYMPWVHIDDAVNAFMSAIEEKINPEPITLLVKHYNNQIHSAVEHA